MHCLTIIIFVLLGSVVSGVDISAIPGTQPNFDLDKYLGVWYDQGKVAPCSFSGSNDFTDWKLEFSSEGKKSEKVILTQDWRSGDLCVNIRSVLTERYPGCFTVKDPLGDLYSGEQKIVATDYKRFSVSWGCTKRSLDGLKCKDAWLSVETRHVHPDPYTLKIIDAVLNKLFGFGLDQTLRIQHGNPC